ncbi:hypothetical protein NESM_000585900 [Novymonas esmeraldas]|uniref:Uncharacterized protein n=1 Tax=Novymonas esmeraldas TaxID=1808958 RepID=A0AAW0EU26_9TRYP
MRRSCAVRAVRRTAPRCALHVSSSVAEEKAKWEQKKREAAEKGFGRRDSASDRVLMSDMFAAPETISGGVAVANLPPKRRETSEFDAYELSTTDFTSLVTPHGTPSKSSLGAGFGVLKDKRLGFLRPRQPLQPYAGSTAIVPKFDENGLPIDETLTPAQVRQKRKEYMRSFEGTTMSASEHFLLVDLDFQKDAMLFGNTREEFERNVTKLKNVIIAYNKWEWTDNLYYYATVILKVLTAWVLMEGLQQLYELRLFAAHYDDFVTAMEADMAALEHKRAVDFADAAAELRRHRPDFTAVLQAIARERDRVADVEARAAREALLAKEAAAEAAATPAAVGLGDLAWEALGANLGGAAAAPSKPVATLSPLQIKDPAASHPMDTTFEKRHHERQRSAAEAREMQRLSAKKGGAGDGHGVLSHVWHRVGGLFNSKPRLRGEELQLYSYAASPTSISSVRALRRILLPRSEDVVQIVREEMVAYKLEKEHHFAHPL